MDVAQEVMPRHLPGPASARMLLPQEQFNENDNVAQTSRTPSPVGQEDIVPDPIHMAPTPPPAPPRVIHN